MLIFNFFIILSNFILLLLFFSFPSFPPSFIFFSFFFSHLLHPLPQLSLSCPLPRQRPHIPRSPLFHFHFPLFSFIFFHLLFFPAFSPLLAHFQRTCPTFLLFFFLLFIFLLHFSLTTLTQPSLSTTQLVRLHR